MVIDRKQWNATTTSSTPYDNPQEILRHEFEHVFQWERYGLGFFGPYFSDKVDRRQLGSFGEQQAWDASGGNRLEYEAYLKGFWNGNRGYVKFTF